jgi:tRNA threonylcarbamoyl adenosine modification protein YeaZ
LNDRLIFAIETSTNRSHLALLEVPQSGVISVRASQIVDLAQGHCERLNDLADSVFAGVSRTDVALVAVGIGPGSFAGTRIGVSFAKGFAYGSGKSLLGVESFESCAWGREPGVYGVVRDARKSELYAAVVEVASDGHVRRVGEAIVASPDTIRAHFSPFFAKIREVLVEAEGLWPFDDAPRTIAANVSAEAVGAIAFARWARGAVDQLHELEPLYVRPPDITTPKNSTLTGVKPPLLV